MLSSLISALSLVLSSFSDIHVTQLKAEWTDLKIIILQLKIKQKTLKKKEEIIRDKNIRAKMCIIASFVNAKFESLNVKN